VLVSVCVQAAILQIASMHYSGDCKYTAGRTFAEVGDGLLDGAPGLRRVGDVGREDEDVRRAALQGGGGDALERLLPPGHQREVRPFPGVLVGKLLHVAAACVWVNISFARPTKYSRRRGWGTSCISPRR
jgi:hypothetical protein